MKKKINKKSLSYFSSKIITDSWYVLDLWFQKFSNFELNFFLQFSIQRILAFWFLYSFFIRDALDLMVVTRKGAEGKKTLNRRLKQFYGISYYDLLF